MLSGDINTNPGPTPSSQQCFSICHWNLNSNTAHNLAKLSLLTAYKQVHSFDIICLSDAYLNFNIEEVLVFITNRSFLEINLDALSTNNLFLTVMIGDFFNGKSSNWYLKDITSFKDSQSEFLASQSALSQVINEPIHILDNSKSCIDLIFTSQPNMIMGSGVHPLLHSNCHHQIIDAKFDLKELCGISPGQILII